MSGWLIYAWIVVGNIQEGALIILVLGYVLGLVGALFVGAEYFIVERSFTELKEMLRPFKIWLKTGTLIMIIALLLAFFVPTSSQFAALYLLPKLTNSEAAKQLSDKSLKVMNMELEKYLKSLASS